MKRFSLARSIVTAAVVAAAFSPAAQAAGKYSSIVFFGDSLTDDGAFGGLPGFPVGNRWTYDTNGKKSDLYADLLARKFGFTLSPANPVNPLLTAGGNDYAQGGAKAADIASQLTNYLATKGGKADPNALYSVWIGGNDVTPALTASQAAGSAAAGQQVMAVAAQATLTQIAALKAAGAKHILVINAPDVGSTPLLFSTVASQAAGSVSASVSANAKLILGGVNPALAGNAALVAATASALKAATPAGFDAAVHAALNAGGTDKSTAITNAIAATTNAIVTGYPPAAAKAVANVLVGAGVIANPTTGAAALATYNAIISGITNSLTPVVAAQSASVSSGITSGYATISGGASALVDSVYNPLLNNGIAKISGGTVIYADINRMMKEVLANPAKFGYSNITGNACASSANLCSDADATFDASKNFFFADPFHPTPTTHKAVAAFIASIMDAPYYAAQLVNNQPIAVNAAQAALDERANNARSVGALEPIVRVSRLTNDQNANDGALKTDGRNTAVTLGLDYQFAAHTSVGFAVTKVKNDTSFGSDAGGFKADNTVVSLFSKYEQGPFAINGDVFFGGTRFSDINRRIQLAALARTETGDTSGHQVGFRAAGSYTVSMGKFSVAPTVSVAFREGVVGGYGENCGDIAGSTSCSTSMHFDEQRVDSMLFGAGVKLNADMGTVQPFASAMLFKDTKDKNRVVSAGQVSAASPFDTEVYTPDNSYGVLNIGIRTKLSNAVSGYASYTKVTGASDEKRDSFSLGLQAAF